MKTHPPHQQLTSSQRYLITRVARLMYSMNAHNVTRSQQLSLARKAAPELPELMREICVIASKTCFVKATKNIQLTINKISRRQSAIKRDTRDVCRYPPTSDHRCCFDPGRVETTTTTLHQPIIWNGYQSSFCHKQTWTSLGNWTISTRANHRTSLEDQSLANWRNVEKNSDNIHWTKSVRTTQSRRLLPQPLLLQQ